MLIVVDYYFIILYCSICNTVDYLPFCDEMDAIFSIPLLVNAYVFAKQIVQKITVFTS